MISVPCRKTINLKIAGLELGNPFPLFGTVLILRVEEFFDTRSEGFPD
jgi:hypothetical protein